MTRIVLEKIENIEKEMKTKLEDSQKLNIEKLNNTKIELEKEFLNITKNFDEKFLEKLNFEIDNKRNSLNHILEEAKNKANSLGENVLNKKENIIQELKNIVMKG